MMARYGNGKWAVADKSGCHSDYSYTSTLKVTNARMVSKNENFLAFGCEFIRKMWLIRYSNVNIQIRMEII